MILKMRIMLSRIEFLFKDHLNIDINSKPRVKLNNKKLKYIINQKKEGREIEYNNGTMH